MRERFGVEVLDPNDFGKLETFINGLLEQNTTATAGTRRTPLDHVLQHVHSLGACCAILQNDVQDPDFLAEHSVYYSKWTVKVPRYCKRVHFFSRAPESTDPLSVIDEMADEPADVYLGFLTLRPIRVSPVAATIIRPLPGQLTHYITSRDEFQVNLAGRQFTIDGTPFLQQDNAVGACAQAAIWMALRTLRRKEGHAAFSPAQITTAATRFLVNGRTLPNRNGLTLVQITEAVRAAGFSPHLIHIRDHASAATADSLKNGRRSLYPYIESGIPVVLALVPGNGIGHAVMLVGHSWQPSPQASQVSPIHSVSDGVNTSHWYDAADWTVPYVIHNDNTGPYLPLPEVSQTEYALSDAVSAVPFLPADVFIDGEEAKVTCIKLLNNSLNILPNDLVLRVYLQDRSDFRKTIISSGMSGDVVRYYRKKWLPRRVWVMEINALDDYGKSPEGAAKRYGEVVLDPASEPEDGHFLSIHLTPDLLPLPQGGAPLTGMIIDRDAFDGEIKALPIASDASYSPLVRSW